MEDPARADYSDISITTVVESEFDELELYSASESAKAAVAKVRRRAKMAALHHA